MNSHGALRSLESPPLPAIDDGVPNFQRLALLLRRRLGLLLLCAGAGLGGALAFLTVSQPLYEATALVLMRRAAPIAAGPPEVPDAIPEPRLRNELEVLRSKELAAEVLGRLGTDIPLGAEGDPRAAEDLLRDAVTPRRIDDFHVFAIEAVSPDPATAARIANAYADAYVARRAEAIAAAAAERRAALGARVEALRAELSARQAEVLGASRSSGGLDATLLRRGELEALIASDRAAYAEALASLRGAERDADPGELRATVLSAAVAPELPRGPKPFMVATLGVFLGLGLGGAIALARENLDQTLRTGDAVRLVLGQPFLGYLPRIRRTRRRHGRPAHRAWRAAVEHPRGRYAETLRFVRARAEDRGHRAGAIAIGVCSARPDEGKSLAAANFAALLAAEGRRTLLIDADTRGPGLRATFAATVAPGLADLPSRACAAPPGPPAGAGFAFLPARGQEGAAPLHLDAAAFERMLAAQRAAYDFIVVDLPALETAAYTRGILPLLDGWVAVTRWGRTPAHAPRTILREEPTLARNLLGVVLSDLEPRALRRYTPTRAPRGMSEDEGGGPARSLPRSRLALAAPRFAAPLAVGEQALFALTNLALQILLARAVSPEAFGAYTIASTYLFIAAVAHQTFLVEPMVVLGAGRLRAARAPYHARLTGSWSAALGLGVCAAGLLLAGLAALLGAGGTAAALAAFAFATPVILYLWLLRRIAFALGRVDLSAAATAVYAAAAAALSGGALALGVFGTGAAILATGVAAGTACAFLRARLRWPPATAPLPPGLAALHLGYGRWAFGAEAAAWALANAPILAAPAWLGLPAAAELRALGLVFMPLLQVASVASLLLLRHFAGAGAAGRVALTRAVLLLGGGGALYTLGAVALGPALVPRLLGARYELDAALLATAGLGAACLVASQGLLVALRAGARARPVLIANLAALALFAVLAPGAARHGLLGVAAAQAAASAAALLVAALYAWPRPARVSST